MERQEHLRRIETLAANLGAAGMSGAILSGEANVDYYSGFRHHAPWSLFARPYFELVNADGRAALVTHGFLATEMARASVVQDIRSYTRSGRAPVQLLAEAMRELGMAKSRVGAELGYEQRLGMSWQDFVALGKALPGIEFVDASELLWRQRMIKSPAEVALMRRAAEITNRAFDASFAAARPGITEKEVAAIAAETMIRHGADRPGFVLVVSGAENYRRLSGKPSDRKLERGDMLWVDMGAVYAGYWADFCRAAIVGQPSKAQQETHAALLEVNQACLDVIRIGAPLRRVAEAAEACWMARGFDVRIGDGRIGHGMGLMATEPPHVALYEETTMDDGLFFTIEPRVVTDDGIFNCEEEIWVTPTGAELITTAPRDLTIVG